MNTPTRFLVFGAGLVLVFGAMFVAGRALVPEETVATWTREANESVADHEGMDQMESHVRGLAVEQDGFRLGEISAPARTGEGGELAFQIIGPDGAPFTDFAVNHERQLHLIVVRADGAEFSHTHPVLDPATGTWSTPWSWEQGGTYRVFTDFRPEGDDAPDVTLGRSVEVAGDFDPATKPLSRQDRVDGFEVSISGDLSAGEGSELTVRVEREGEPETHIEPYLGAFGHLVALREGDLAYVHVHAEAGHDESGDGSDHDHGAAMAGPEIGFLADVPTPGRYLLYLDFKVRGQVHTAEFVLEAK